MVATGVTVTRIVGKTHQGLERRNVRIGVDVTGCRVVLGRQNEGLAYEIDAWAPPHRLP